MSNYNKLKVITVVGTRPEIIRLSRIINYFDESFEHILVHTGQNYDVELNEIFFKDLNIKKPKYILSCAGKDSIETISNILLKTHRIFQNEKPDAIVVLGDTNSSLSVISAKKLKIPIFHIEAGNRCFDQRVPEEINRKIVDHVSDINLTYSEMARHNLYRESFPPDRVFKIGSPLFEVINHFLDKIKSSKILSNLKLKDKNFFLFSFHREENIDEMDNFLKIVEIINSLNKKFKIPIIVSTHPRTRKKIKEMSLKFKNNIRLLKPLGYFDYVKLQISSRVVLSDSGSIIEESNILDFPAICLRESNERQEGIESGVTIMQLTNKDIIDSIKILEKISFKRDLNKNALTDYARLDVSKKVVFLIKSYKDYVHRKVWFRK
jgi:UDP-N-acetylglucosamine 2-epimerase (non-hydrolysing)